MRNFARVLRLSLRYRWTLAASAVCALVVALLWGANIGTIYPIVESLFRGKNLQTWIASEVEKGETQVAELRERISGLDQEIAAAPADDAPGLQTSLGQAQDRLAAEERALATHRSWQPYVERYVPQDIFQTLLLIIAVMCVATLTKDIFIVIGSVLVDRMTSLAILDLRNNFYRRTLRLDLATFGENSSNELLSRFTYDVDSVAGGLQALLGKAIREPLKMIACLAMAGWICWRLLLLSMIIVPVAAYLVTRLGKSLKRANRKAMEEMSLLYNILAESFGGIKVVKAFTMEPQERRRFRANSRQFYLKGMKIAWYNALVHPVTELMAISTVCLAFMAGAYLVFNQQTHLGFLKISDRPLNQGALLVFWGLLIGASDPARKLSEIFNRLQRAAAASDRIYQLYDREAKVTNPARPLELPRHASALVFENVSFSYQSSDRVLEDITLRIPFGETLAIVGPNGCGKSTLASLIPRFFDPTEGVIRLDGMDLRDLRLRDLRSQIGLVTQETLLFDDTVANNIRYGTPHATLEQVIAAAQQAHAHRFIEQRLEHGYETVVGPQGNRLSGGQRQRIALARAILRDPSLLILDEATSQVDLESEQLIQMVLEQFIRNRTTIIITHRLATLDLADRILVMQAGKILDVGTHAELIARCDLYQRLYHIQFRESA